MTKQEQINELTKVIGNTWFVDFECNTHDVEEVLDNVEISSIARELLEQGYRKLPEDSVVLSKEEYEDYKKHIDTCTEEYHRGQHETELYYKNIQIPRERKKTAEKIYTKIKDSFLMDSKNRYAFKLWLEEEFGIEIKE